MDRQKGVYILLKNTASATKTDIQAGRQTDMQAGSQADKQEGR